MEALKETVHAEGIENIAIYPFLHGQDFQDALAISDCALVTLVKGATGLCVPSKTYSYMMQGIPLLAVMDEGDIVSDIERGAGMRASALSSPVNNIEEFFQVAASYSQICFVEDGSDALLRC